MENSPQVINKVILKVTDFLEKLLQQMNLQSHDRVIEIGCGDGSICRKLASMAHLGAVVGIESSNEVIDLARSESANFSNILYLWVDAKKIPWQEKYFTHAVSIATLTDNSDRERMLNELFRVLTPNGSLWMLLVLSDENPPTELSTSADHQPASQATVNDLYAMLRRCSFQQISHSLITGKGINQTATGALIINASRPPD
ncbi:MAG: hypothetical protein A3F68_03350 [Acidobacteria bacterium RIFCSPLOWO2_12_FULL_54_10]|nr:MAG: hypothetical protein A3F68_03350 [Acidobacteria bacterium RIFCSPLOWO2_12_FULL_54_10]